MRLDGRTALVTGSSRGIGAEIARRLAADGAKLVLHASRSADSAKLVADAIRAAGGSADIVVGDLTEGDTAARLVDDAFAVHGALDILVCNAGGGRMDRLADLDAAAVDASLSLNLRSVILATAAFARVTESPHGRVILISSLAAHHPAVGASVYSAGKAGAEAFLRSAAQELGGRGITLNAVAPGMVATDMIQGHGQQLIDTVAGWTALRRIGAPQDIAAIVAFLASDDARWVTGVTVPAGGGQITSATNILARAG